MELDSSRYASRSSTWPSSPDAIGVNEDHVGIPQGVVVVSPTSTSLDGQLKERELNVLGVVSKLEYSKRMNEEDPKDEDIRIDTSLSGALDTN